MSTLKVSNIQATGETASRAVSGVAAAWVNFNGTGTVATRDSFNTASIIDNGTGDFRVPFVSAMSNSNYAATFGGKGTSLRIYYSGGNAEYSDPSTTFVEFASYSEGGAARIDAEYHFGAIHGDLA